MDFFPGATFPIREGNAYIFSKYPPFDGMGDAYFKGYTCLMFLPNVPGAMFIPESRVESILGQKYKSTLLLFFGSNEN